MALTMINVEEAAAAYVVSLIHESSFEYQTAQICIGDTKGDRTCRLCGDLMDGEGEEQVIRVLLGSWRGHSRFGNIHAYPCTQEVRAVLDKLLLKLRSL